MEVPERPENTSEACKLSSQVGEIRRVSVEARCAVISAPRAPGEFTSLGACSAKFCERKRSLFTHQCILVSLGDVTQDSHGIAAAELFKYGDDPHATHWIRVIEAGFQNRNRRPATRNETPLGLFDPGSGFANQYLDLPVDYFALIVTGCRRAGTSAQCYGEGDGRHSQSESDATSIASSRKSQPGLELCYGAGMDGSTEARLEPFERFALEFGRIVNESELPKKLQHQFILNVSVNWMRPFMSRRSYVDNVDWLIAPPSDRGVVFACNHRSFFDSYVYLFALFTRGASWPRKVYFPVRSDFFYDRPLGVMVNLAMGGGCMYPPIYRDADKRSLNNDALERIGSLLDQPNSMVGLHPEGTRNQGDPYKLLPAQPGIGQIVLKSKPLVVPVFINGLSNDFFGSLRSSFRPGAKREDPIIICFGNPVDYDEFLGSKPRAALYKRCADKIARGIADTGQREKQLRAAISSGEIPSSDPNWLWHAKNDQ